VDQCLDNRGPATSAADPLARPPAAPRDSVRLDALPPGGTYALVRLPDGLRHPLKVGINAVGRSPQNDLVLRPTRISRRHCVVLVHADGGCEVYDTASLNRIWVNGKRVDRADLFPGDRLELCELLYLVAWVGPDGDYRPAEDPPEFAWMDGADDSALTRPAEAM
jgi:hypothetical protein